MDGIYGVVASASTTRSGPRGAVSLARRARRLEQDDRRQTRPRGGQRPEFRSADLVRGWVGTAARAGLRREA